MSLTITVLMTDPGWTSGFRGAGPSTNIVSGTKASYSKTAVTSQPKHLKSQHLAHTLVVLAITSSNWAVTSVPPLLALRFPMEG